MKKILFMMAALMAVFAGIAAVSAYEGHEIDIKAHVENALMVETDDIDFGMVFPQEELETQFRVGLSESFRVQSVYSIVQYKMYWEPKSLTHGGPSTTPIFEDPTNPGYFIPIWPYIEVQVNETDYDQEDYEDMGDGLILVGENDLGIEGNPCDVIHFVINPPVFDEWYNELTDPETPSGVLGPDFYYTTFESASCGFAAEVPHTDLGSNFKIQVVDITTPTPG